MTLFKKITYFLIIFVILNIITIYNYDYITGENKNIPFNFTIAKKDNILNISGVFPNENDSKIVLNSLKIDKSDNIIYDDNTSIDSLLIEKLKPFIEKFKEDSINGSKIIYNSNGLYVIADLKSDESIKALNEINSKNNLSATLNMKVLVKDEKALSKEIEEIKSIVEKDDKKEEVIAPAVVEQVPTIKDIQEQVNNILKTNKITFARASTNLTPESIKTVEEIAKILKNHKYEIEVGGHTDSKGNPTLNQNLSEKRAQSVKDSLINFGINKDSIKSFGYGNKFPIAQEDELGLSEENRRVEIILKEKEVK